MPPVPGAGARRTPLRPVAVALLAAVALALLQPVPARSQQGQVSLALLEQPPWNSPGDSLGIRVRVTNRGDQALDGFQIQLARYPAVTGRLELHESYDGVSLTASISRLEPQLKTTLEPGDSTVVELNDKVAALDLTEDGVYPLTLTVVSADQTTELASITTEIVYYQSPPEEPLNLVLVVPLTNLSWKDPHGGFRADPDTGDPLVSEALDPETGWLSGVVGALDKVSRPTTRERRPRKKNGRPRITKEPGLSAAVAPSPRLMEELRNASTSYSGAGTQGEGAAEAVRSQARSVLDRLDELLSSGRAQPLLTPYSFVDLPTLTAQFDLEDLNRQLSEGTVALKASLPDVTFDPKWFFAPGSRWDDRSLGTVQLAGADNARHTFFTRVALGGNRETGCPAGVQGLGLTFACPASVGTESGRVDGFVADPELQRRMAELSREADDRLDLQRFFAETAMIHLEQPGSIQPRVLQVSVPSLWHPSPYLAGRFLGGIAAAPWLRTLTPREGLDRGPNPRHKELVDQASPLPQQPDQVYFDEIDSARLAVERFAEIGPPSARLKRLRRNLLVAQSRVWWSSESEAIGRSFATLTRQEADGELDKITVDGLDTTLTSQAAPVELTVFNSATYPVTVDVDLDSNEGAIRIDQDELNDLNGLTIGPGGN